MAEPNEQLASLADDPRWAELGKVLEARMDKEFTTLARQFATKDARPDYEQLQWVRGVFAGMKFLYKQPALEARELSKLLARERGEAE